MSSTKGLPPGFSPRLPTAGGPDLPSRTHTNVNTTTRSGNGMVDGRYTSNFDRTQSSTTTWNHSGGVGGSTSDLFTPKASKWDSLLSKLPTWSKSGSFDKTVAAWQKSGSFSNGIAKGQGSIALAEAYLKGQGNVSFKNGALTATGDLQAAATLIDAQGSVSIGNEKYGADLSGYAYVGAKANAHGELAFDPAHGVIAAKVGAEAFVGARAGAEGQVRLGDFGSVGGRAEAWAGVGAAFHAEAGIKDGHFKARFDIGAALGIGFKVGFNVDINFKGIANTVKNAVKKVIAAPVNLVKNVAKSVGNFVKKLKFW